MNSDTVIQLLQKGFRVTLGATASLIEIMQDPRRRNENLTKLQSELSELADELAAKGEMTEQEARNFVDTILTRQNQPNHSASSTATAPVAPPSSATTSPDIQLDLEELTAQISAIRAELERLREQDSQP